MPNTSDPRDPHNFLHPNEVLLWQGRPDPHGATRAVRFLRWFGYLMLSLFIFFLAITWANRDELEGTGIYLLVFLVVLGGGTILFLYGIPTLSRAILKSTRYAVAGHHAIIIRGVFGHTEVLRYPIPEKKRITTRSDKAGYQDVIFASMTGRVKAATSGSTTVVTHGIGFERLTPEAGEAARSALEQIRGKGGPNARFAKKVL